jgi:hypothetical protein
MDIVQRAKNICLTPGSEWQVIAAEETPTSDLITGYVAPLVAVGAIAGFIGGSLVGISLPFIGTYRVPLVTGLVGAVITFAISIVGIFVLSLVINALAPTFGGQQSSSQALKVAVYSYTPGWIAGVLQILPALGVLAILAALYGLYLLYLGLPRLMKCPEDKAIGYTVVVVICAIVISVVITAVGGMVVGAGAFGAGALGAGVARGTMLGGAPVSSRSSSVQFDKDSPMGKLQALGQKLEESNKKMEAAQKSGDANAQAAAAMESLGTLLGGGKRVDPIGIDQLKPFVPDTFLGLPKKSSNAEKVGAIGIMVSKAEATYGDSSKTVTLNISDTGGASGLMGLASWIGTQEEKEDEYSSERTRKVNGRIVHEKLSKVSGGTNEFGIVLGDRFVVSAKGQGVGLDELKTAVSGIDLARIESLKDVGVQK